MSDIQIDKEPRVVTITTTHPIGIGRHRCHQCREWTPEPSQEVLERFVLEHPHDSYAWPFDDWWPEDWVRVEQGSDHVTFVLCGACADRIIFDEVTT